MVISHALLKSVYSYFGLTEDDYLLLNCVLLCEIIKKICKSLIFFVVVIHNMNYLFDVFVYCQTRVNFVCTISSNLYMNGCHLTELLCEILDFWRPSCTEHECLPVRVLNLSNNLLNILFKSHIKHPVCFIETQISAPVQVCVATF